MPTETTYLQRDSVGYAKATQAAGTSAKSSSVSVGTTATALPATSLTNRRRLYIKNINNSTFYIGASDVTTTDGYPVRQYEEVVIDMAGVTIYAIAGPGASGTAKVLEMA
jgi:hypothetical protein